MVLHGLLPACLAPLQHASRAASLINAGGYWHISRGRLHCTAAVLAGSAGFCLAVTINSQRGAVIHIRIGNDFVGLACLDQCLVAGVLRVQAMVVVVLADGLKPFEQLVVSLQGGLSVLCVLCVLRLVPICFGWVQSRDLPRVWPGHLVKVVLFGWLFGTNKLRARLALLLGWCKRIRLLLLLKVVQHREQVFPMLDVLRVRRSAVLLEHIRGLLTGQALFELCEDLVLNQLLLN